MGKFTYQAWRYPGRTPELEHDSGGHESSYARTRYSARLSHKDDPQEICFPKTSITTAKAVNA